MRATLCGGDMPEIWEAQSVLETGAPRWVLRDPPGAPDASTTSETRAETRDEEPAVLACATCREPITTEAERMDVAGAHQHSFMNPHGFYYRIGCFAAAQALKAEGGWSGDWSWFPPCQWQIQRCARCDEHLGWLFRAPERRFYGLALDRLIRLGSD